MEVIDTNVSLFRWPFRRLPLDTTDKLVAALRGLGVRRAWAGTFEALLHRDLRSANTRLATECRKHDLLTPIGAMNLSLVGWEKDLTDIVHNHRMPGVRLLPNYHGYSLASAEVAKLFGAAAEHGFFIQIVAALEDVRTQSGLVRAPDTDLTPLSGQLDRHPDVRVQILNLRRLPRNHAELAERGVCFDISRIDGTDGVPALIRELPDGHVMFGSHAPFLIPAAALIRVHEADQLSEAQVAAVYSGNAARFLRRVKR